MIKGVIFDLDQTLIDTSIAEIHRKRCEWQAVYSLIQRFQFYDGIKEVLSKIQKDGIRICIVTTSQSKYAQLVVNHHKIPQEFVIDYSSTARRKPYPDPMFKALEKFSLTNKEVISFGDRAIDIESSNLAGIYSVACMWGTSERELVIKSRPSRIIENPGDILKCIL